MILCGHEREMVNTSLGVEEQRELACIATGRCPWLSCCILNFT